MGFPFKALAVAAALVAGGTAAQAVTLGQSDSFSGSANGWTSGSNTPLPPVVDPGGFLRLSASGVAGPGGKLVVFNAAQWTGNYTAAGVTGITLDVANFGSTDLNLRLQLSGLLIGKAITLDSVFLPAASGWTQAQFALTAQDLTGDSVAQALANVSELRLFHSTGASFPGPDIAATLGIDNVTAVPEVGSAWMLLFGLAGIGAFGRRDRRTA